MVWGRKLEKQDLTDAGLNLDEITTKINSAATKEDVDAIKNTVSGYADTLKDLGNKLQELAARPVGTNDDNGNNSTRGNNTNDGRQNNDPLADIDSVSFMEDPVSATKRITAAAVTGVQLHSLQMACDIAYDEAKRTLPNFDVFADEIKKEWETYPVPARGIDPRKLIKNLYDLVRGRHVDEITTDTNKREGKYNMVQSVRSSGTPDLNKGGASQKPEDNLTQEELNIAARFGMTPEDYAKSKGGLKYV